MGVDTTVRFIFRTNDFEKIKRLQSDIFNGRANAIVNDKLMCMRQYVKVELDSDTLMVEYYSGRGYSCDFAECANEFYRQYWNDFEMTAILWTDGPVDYDEYDGIIQSEFEPRSGEKIFIIEKDRWSAFAERFNELRDNPKINNEKVTLA